jgi:hypothetical protein
MGLLAWLRSLASVRATEHPLASRHERREAARRRSQQVGGPAWTDEDRHLGPSGERLVADVAPGTPGHDASVRTSREDNDRRRVR